MEDVLFCPNCGAKTLEDQDDWDYRGGEKYLCRTCNTVYQMACEGVEEPTVEEDPKEEYRPVISFAEACTARMLEKCSTQLVSAFERTSLVFSEDPSVEKNFPPEGKIIKFRRYAPLEAEPKPQGENENE